MSELTKRLRSAGVIPESLGAEAADALDVQAQEIARLEADKAFVEQMLGNLLAVIHRDGGHHQGTVGTPIAVDEAMQAIYALRARLAEAERDAERLDWLIDNFWIALNGREARAMTREQIDAARGGL